MSGKIQRPHMILLVVVAAAAVVTLVAALQGTQTTGAARGTPDARDAPREVTLTYPLFLPSVLVQPPRFHATTVWTTSITIPTHVYDYALDFVHSAPFNLSYPVLDRSRYDPIAVEPRAYTLVVLENDFLRVSLMPQLGGRVYQIVHKASGKSMLYQNPVIKPSPWGPPEMGWWLAVGGIEWCLPVEEHGYEWGVPWQYEVEQFQGGARVSVQDSDRQDRIRARIKIILQDSEAVVRVMPTIENPTAAGIDFQFWLNAMLAPGSEIQPTAETRFVMSATAATVHSTGDNRLPGAGQGITWPIYNGVDWSRLGNWDQWFGFFQRPQASGGFQAVYDEASDAGVVRAYASDEVSGAKFFAFGWAHALSPSLYTDGSSAYVEMHGGATPQFGVTRHLFPGQSLTWKEQWYPAVGLGALSWANGTVALRLDYVTGTTQARFTSNRLLSGVRVQLVRLADATVVHEQLLPQLGIGEIHVSPWVSAEAGIVIFEGNVLVARYP